MKLALLAFVAFPSLALSIPKCEEGDLLKTMSAEQQRAVLASGFDWLKHATSCDFGAYKVFTPTDRKSDDIVIIKGGKPFIYYAADIGINLMQDLGAGETGPLVTVQDWDHDGRFERLDYLVVDATGNVLGNARDKSMTGAVVVTPRKNEKAARASASATACPAPPVATSDAAICLAGQQGAAAPSQTYALKYQAEEHEGYWFVEYWPKDSNVRGGGGKLRIDKASGRVTFVEGQR